MEACATVRLSTRPGKACESPMCAPEMRRKGSFRMISWMTSCRGGGATGHTLEVDAYAACAADAAGAVAAAAAVGVDVGVGAVVDDDDDDVACGMYGASQQSKIKSTSSSTSF